MTSGIVIAIVLLTVLLLAAAYFIGRRAVARRQETRYSDARRAFFQRREWLEANFLKLASQSGMPRGLVWVDCDFEDQVAFARDRKSGELSALVAVTIKFEAVEGGGMEDVEAVANRKAATALFRHDGQNWSTDGRAIFNLNPAEAIAYYQAELEMVE